VYNAPVLDQNVFHVKDWRGRCTRVT